MPRGSLTRRPDAEVSDPPPQAPDQGAAPTAHPKLTSNPRHPPDAMARSLACGCPWPSPVRGCCLGAQGVGQGSGSLSSTCRSGNPAQLSSGTPAWWAQRTWEPAGAGHELSNGGGGCPSKREALLVSFPSSLSEPGLSTCEASLSLGPPQSPHGTATAAGSMATGGVAKLSPWPITVSPWKQRRTKLHHLGLAQADWALIYNLWQPSRPECGQLYI